MPVLPGVSVSASAVSGFGANGSSIGAWFVEGLTERGPLAPKLDRPIRSLADFVSIYGDRVSWSVLYDAVDTFFRCGGTRLWVSRVAGPSATLSALTLNDRAGTPLATLVVKPKGPGVYGTRYTVQVTNGSAANSFVLIIAFDGIEVERTGDLFSPTDAVNWGNTTSQHVNITDSGSATASPNNIPAVLAATALTGGTDDRASITDTEWAAALTRFTQGFGPGMVSAPGRGTSTGHSQLIAHGIAYNRQAILDAPDQASQSTLSALAVSDRTAAAYDEFGTLVVPWLRVPGIIAGTQRTVPASAVTAGVTSRQVSSGPANVPAAGDNGEAPWVLDVAQTFTDAERATLNDAGVVVLRKRYGSANVTVYGNRTLDIVGGWKMLSNQLLRLQITDECALIGEQFMFDQIDGRGQKLAEFRASLSAMLQVHYAGGELYGASAEEAYRVDVGAGVNTPETLAAGQLRALLSLRMSPAAEQVQIQIIKYPITESLTV